MHSWPHPRVPVPVSTAPVLQLRDTATSELINPTLEGTARLYVCGITPYDSTHLGHAFTYVSFDTLVRAWQAAGLSVRYAQNVTDVDDPLLERAEATGVGWQELAMSQIDLFRSDMTALNVIPPQHYLGVVESIDLVVSAVSAMVANGSAYKVGEDVYADLSVDDRFGSVSHLDRADMAELFAERGGDPDREGKRDPLDPLLWRAERDGEPSWDGGTLGRGRPGWHIECSAIAERYLGLPVSVEGGGADLIFPHHDMGTSHLRRFAQGTGGQAAAGSTSTEPITAYMHTGLVAYQGEKMSKSLGNLVFVSKLLEDGVDARAIRLLLLAHHYSDSWEYTDALLREASGRLASWQRAVTPEEGASAELIRDIYAAVADNLDTPRALEVIDAAAAHTGLTKTVATVIDALLGVNLDQ